MAQEYRTSQYWGSGAEGKWYLDNIKKQAGDTRFGGAQDFIRYAIRFCLQKDSSLKHRPASIPGDNT